jgi:NADH dehydrogenase
LIDLDHARKVVAVAAVSGDEGVEVLPQREIAYDTLVLAIGSETNYFGVPGG